MNTTILMILRWLYEQAWPRLSGIKQPPPRSKFHGVAELKRRLGEPLLLSFETPAQTEFDQNEMINGYVFLLKRSN
jgi:hypothetical protein